MAVVLHETQRAAFYAPFYVALALNFYEREGVDVVLSSSSVPGDASRVLFDGRADVSWGGPMRVMLTYEREPSADLVCFCEVVRRDPFFLVGRQPRPNFRLDDLRGLRLGILREVPTPWLCLQQDVRDAGVDPAELNVHADLSIPENAAALRRGERDVVHIAEPYVTQLIEEGNSHMWYAPATRGPTSYTCFYGRRSVLAERRSEFVLMTRAVGRALEWICSAAPVEVAGAISSFFPDTAEGTLAGAMGRYQGLGIWSGCPAFSRSGFERLKLSIVSGGLVRTGQRFEDIVDDTLAGAAASMPVSRHSPVCRSSARSGGS